MHRREGNGWEMLSLEETLSILDQVAELPIAENVICILQDCKKRKSRAYDKHAYAHICNSG